MFKNMKALIEFFVNKHEFRKVVFFMTAYQGFKYKANIRSSDYISQLQKRKQSANIQCNEGISIDREKSKHLCKIIKSELVKYQIS